MLLNNIASHFLKKLDDLEFGALELVTPDGQRRTYKGKNPGVHASMIVHSWDVIKNVMKRGDIGFVESYRAGHCETNNLQNLFALALQNERLVKNYLFGSRAFQMLARFSYLFKLNTVKGSKRNIHAHYDLGNDFYELWLDPTMTYSSALFIDENESLQQAQDNKYDRILDRLSDDKGTDTGSILEIGCGWGGFAERAASRGDFDLKGITLSQEQHDFARNRLGDKANIALEDYRIQTGKFDNIVSIEMFEAVGERYWPTYFNKIKSLLAPNGKAVIQTITIDEKHFDRYRRGGDAIRSYIFPGGMLPSPSRFDAQVQKAGMKTTDTYYFGQDYAKTLELWLEDFDAKQEQIKALGFDNSFIRLWRFYLAACIAGFQTGRINVMQTEITHA